MRLVRSGLARDTSWLLAGQVSRVLAQSLGFVLIARTLGPSDLGTFAAIVGVSTLLSPFVNLGAYSLAIRDVVDGVTERHVTGNYLALTSLTLPVAMVALLLLAELLVPAAPWLTVAGVGLGTLLGGRLTSLFRGIHVARGEVWAAGMIEAALGAAYVAGAAVLAWMGGTFELWAWIYCAHALGVGALGIAALVARFGRPEWTFENVRRRLSDGMHFGIGNLAENANAELDKAVLLRLASAEDAGLYAASHRVVAVALVPSMALFGAMYRRYFKAGQSGLADSRAVAWRLVPAIVAYGLFAWAAIAIGAPVAAMLFGAEFGETTSVVRWLAPMVLLYTMTIPFLDALTGARLQPLRAYGLVAALGVGLLLNVLLDGRLGWKGAAIATLASQAFLLFFALVSAPRLARLFATPQTPAAAAPPQPGADAPR
jgi:O-antigen/teichoic acid export membrane protein